MKNILLGLFLICIYSCDPPNMPRVEHESKDSINGMTTGEYKAHLLDSMTNSVVRSAYFDTVGVSTAPVKVLKAVLYREEYSSYKSISITFKNVSDKKIDAIKFSWYGENAFKDPADMGGMENGFGGGFMDKTLRPGQIMTLQWNILSRDGKKAFAWPTEIQFADGTKWESARK